MKFENHAQRQPTASVVDSAPARKVDPEKRPSTLKKMHFVPPPPVFAARA